MTFSAKHYRRPSCKLHNQRGRAEGVCLCFESFAGDDFICCARRGSNRPISSDLRAMPLYADESSAAGTLEVRSIASSRCLCFPSLRCCLPFGKKKWRHRSSQGSSFDQIGGVISWFHCGVFFAANTNMYSICSLLLCCILKFLVRCVVVWVC